MKNKMAFALTALVLTISTKAIAAQPFIIEGQTKTVIANSSYNINQWNTMTISGVGQGNLIKLYTPNKTLELPLSSPLYRITDYYCDKVTQINGTWGVERNVAVKTFTGDENWQLVKNQSFLNNKTFVFTCKNNENISISNGYCTHFDVHTYSSQRTNIYDGISFGNDDIFMRFMNVRNIKTVDALKGYLKNQYNSGNPVRLYYASPKPQFQPFEKEIQTALNSSMSGNIGYSDFNITSIKTDDNTKVNTNIFTKSSTGNLFMDRFLSAAESVQIFNSDGNSGFFVKGIRPTTDGFSIEIKDKNQNSYIGKVIFSKADFMTSKPTEVLFCGEKSTSIRLMLHLSKIQLPNANISDFSFEQTGILNSCIANKQFILPDVIPVLKGTQLDFNNALLHGNISSADQIIIKDSNGNILSSNGKFTANTEGEFNLFINGNLTATTNIAFVQGHVKAATILFMGDSLLNQNYYTNYFVNMFNEEQIHLLGTRGNDGSKHEGRGGWSAYDYCNSSSKYGFDNPFLNKGKFDFNSYMKKNGYTNVDYVVISLGINDINLDEHNTNAEILSSFNKITDSILAYNPDAKIIINAPIMPFATEETAYPKDKRLEFTKALYDHYSGTNVYISPTYLRLNGYDDFKFTMPIINNDNQNSAMVVTDTTHPNLDGYKTLAAASYSDINFLSE